MLNFFSRVLNGWAAEANNNNVNASRTCTLEPDCTCRACTDAGDLGLNRSDVNFYFAALSVCAPLLTPLVLSNDAKLNEASDLPVNRFPPSSESSSQSMDNSSTSSGYANNNDDVPSSQGTVVLQEPTKTAPVIGRYDHMLKLVVSKVEPQPHYYVPTKSRLPAAHHQQSSQASCLTKRQKSDILRNLQKVLEEYRMLATNASRPSNAEINPTSDQSVIISVSTKKYLGTSEEKDQQEEGSPKEIPMLPYEERVSSSIMANSRTCTESETTTALTALPAAVQLSIPTERVVSPISPVLTPPALQTHKLLSLSPAMEHELAERAAEVWGMAVGYDSIERYPSTDFDSKSNFSAETSGNVDELAIAGGPQTAERESLKLQIRSLLHQLGLEDAFTKQLRVVRKGKSKFHQAQQVVPGVWVGSFYTASNRLQLLALKITHIVCCVNITPPFTRDFHYMILPCQDAKDEDILRFFPRTNHFIKQALQDGGRVLVHCGAGVSRAPTVCAAFLISELKVSAELALKLVQAVRPFADPNIGFREQLAKFETMVQEELSMSDMQNVVECSNEEASFTQKVDEEQNDRHIKAITLAGDDHSTTTTYIEGPKSNKVNLLLSLDDTHHHSPASAPPSNITTPYLKDLILSSSSVLAQRLQPVVDAPEKPFLLRVSSEGQNLFNANKDQDDSRSKLPSDYWSTNTTQAEAIGDSTTTTTPNKLSLDSRRSHEDLKRFTDTDDVITKARKYSCQLAGLPGVLSIVSLNFNQQA